MSSEGRDKPMTFPESEGEGTDGRGSPGIIEEKNREAEAAEADSAFEFEGDDTDGEGSSGILDEETRGTARSGTDGDDSDGAGSGGILDDEPEN